MLVIPQAALTGKMKGKRMQYHNACNKDLGRATRHDCALIATTARFRQSLPFKAGGASPRPAQVPRTVCAFGTNTWLPQACVRAGELWGSVAKLLGEALPEGRLRVGTVRLPHCTWWSIKHCERTDTPCAFVGEARRLGALTAPRRRCAVW